ncbi:hypothetical protein ACFX2C_021925 [Malus domestica]
MSKHPTRRFSTALRNPFPIRKENGQMNSPDFYGHITQPNDEPPVRLISFWHLVQKQSFLPNVIVPSISTLLPSIEQNSKEMSTSLDLAEEKSEQTITCITAYQQQLFFSYNKRAKIRQFQLGDLVLRKAFITSSIECSRKMDPIWECLYKINKVGGKGSYTLATMNDKEMKSSGMPTI